MLCKQKISYFHVVCKCSPYIIWLNLRLKTFFSWMHLIVQEFVVVSGRINSFTTSILKSLMIPAISLALSNVINSQITLIFIQNYFCSRSRHSCSKSYNFCFKSHHFCFYLSIYLFICNVLLTAYYLRPPRLAPAIYGRKWTLCKVCGIQNKMKKPFCLRFSTNWLLDQ